MYVNAGALCCHKAKVSPMDYFLERKVTNVQSGTCGSLWVGTSGRDGGVLWGRRERSLFTSGEE